MLLFELYQESKGSTFTHDGVDYNLNKVLKAVDDTEIHMYDVSSLKWILKYTEVDPERVKTAKVSKPILVTDYEGKKATIDGAHRLTKAVEAGTEQIRGKYVSAAVLTKSKV